MTSVANRTIITNATPSFIIGARRFGALSFLIGANRFDATSFLMGASTAAAQLERNGGSSISAAWPSAPLSFFGA
jgi:hypothetical protein